MAVRFDAETDAYTTTASVPQGAYTVTWWAYLSVDRNAYSTMWEPGSTSGTGLYTQIGPDANGTNMAVHSHDGATLDQADMTVGQWYCFSYTQTAAGGTARLRMGSSPESMSAVQGTAPSGTPGTLRIGRSVWGGEWFNGRIANWKQWSAVLTDAEIEAELAQYEHIRTSNFVRRFDFKTAPQTVPDAGSGNLTAGSTATTTETGPSIPDSVETPITVDVPPVDIAVTLNAPTPDRAVVARPDPVDIAVTLQTPTVEFTSDVIADIAPMQVDVDVLAVEGAKIVDVPPVDIAVELIGVEPGRFFDVPPVDIVHEHPTVSILNQDADPIEIDVTVLPVETAKIVDVPPIDIAIEPTVPEVGKFYDVGPVDITTEAAGVSYVLQDTRPVEIDVEIMPVSIAYSRDTSQAGVDLPVAVPPEQARVLARSIRSGRWLHLDLPLSNLRLTKTLSGPQEISGEFPAEIRDLADAGLEPWGTMIYVEENDEIRGHGILMPTKVDTGQKLTLRAMGVSGYPSGIPYLGADVDRIQEDPANIIRLIWNHLQSYPDAQLGVEVVGATPVRIGEPVAENVEFTTGDGQQVAFQAGGPYTLRWFNGTDCGSEIEDLAKEAPLEWYEREFWNDPKTKDYVRLQIVLCYPRAGSRRTDLSFAQDENLLEGVGPAETEGLYASQVVLFGGGEGSSKVLGTAGGTSPTRIRRVAVLDRKTVDNATRANASAREDYERRQALLDIPEIVVKARHPNARLGSYGVGDDVPVEGEIPWAGYVRQWQRILSYTYEPEQEIVRIQVRRSETFVYGGA